MQNAPAKNCIAEASQCIPRVGLTVPAMDAPHSDTLKNCNELSGGRRACQSAVVSVRHAAIAGSVTMTMRIVFAVKMCSATLTVRVRWFQPTDADREADAQQQRE